MKEIIRFERTAPILGLTDEILYLQKPYWCGIAERSLKMSIIQPRYYYDYDPKPEKRPLLVWICGGGFMKMDRKVHIPELVEFARSGYVVASIDYSVLPYTEYPETITEVKAAIRYLKAHAEQYHIDRNKVIVAGESAGAYLAGLAAATNGQLEFDRNLTTVGSRSGEPVMLDPAYEEEDSCVRGAVLYYPPACLEQPNPLRVRTDNYADILDYINEKTVPMYMIHGDVDNQVPTRHSEALYAKLQEAGVKKSRLTILEGANHGDALCYTDEMKKRVIDFMNTVTND